MTPVAADTGEALPENIVAGIDAAARRHLVDSDGVRICWRNFGHCGPPLVLLHGGQGSWLHWVRNVEPLARHFSVWVPDLPGYGDSDAPAGTTLASLLEPTIATLDALIGASAPVFLAGFSFGGLVAAHLAARRGKVEKLALFGPAGHGGRLRRTRALLGWRDAADAAELARRMRHNLAAHMLHEEASIDALALHVHTVSSLRTRFRSQEISLGGGLQQALERSDAEMLLVWSEHDLAAEPAVLAPALTEGWPKRRAHLVSGAGHWVQYERAAAVDRLLCDWFLGDRAA